MAAAALFPVLTVVVPPLADLPNHLARFHIMNNLAGDAGLQRHYAVEWQLLSFQSSDLIVPLLARLVGLETAARLSLVATYVSIMGGVVCLHLALFKRVGLWPATASLVFYNFMLAWGLLSVLFTAGLALMLFAGWIATARYEGTLRSLAFALGALVVFLFHFFAFAVFALLFIAFELSRWLQEKPLDWPRIVKHAILSGGVLVAPGGLFLLARHSSASTISFYGGLDDKIRAVLSPINMYFGISEYALALVLIGLVVLGRRLDLFVFARSIRWPILASVAAAVLMPSMLLSVWGADFRLPTIVALLLIGGTELVLKTRRQAAAFAALLIALMLFRSSLVTADWRRVAADTAEFRTAIAVIERGSTVVAVQSIDDHRNPPAASLFPYRHMADYVVIDRNAFLPLLFTTQTPLRFAEADRDWTSSDQNAMLRKPDWHPTSPAFAAADADTIRQIEQTQQAIEDFDMPTSTIDWSNWPERFDYLIDFGYGRSDNPVPALLTEVHRGSFFTIFRIHPPHP